MNTGLFENSTPLQNQMDAHYISHFSIFVVTSVWDKFYVGATGLWLHIWGLACRSLYGILE